MGFEYTQQSYDDIYDPRNELLLSRYDNSLTKYLYPNGRRIGDIARKFMISLNFNVNYYGKDITLKEINTIYSSLIFDNMYDIELIDCNIGINEEVPELYQDEIGIFNKNGNMNIKNSSIDYPILSFNTPSYRISIIEDSVLNFYGTYRNCGCGIDIIDSYINDLVINNSVIRLYIKNSTTIKNLYVQDSNLQIVSENASSINIENIYCMRSYIKFKNEGSSTLSDKEIMQNGEITNSSYYKGDIDKYDSSILLKLNHLYITGITER